MTEINLINGYIASILYPVICLLISLLVYKLGLEKKYTRKVVHILVGFEWCILYHYFGNSYHTLIVCIAFTALLLLAYNKKLMPMISSEKDNAPGTVYYGASMSVMALISLIDHRFMLPFGLAVFCTSIGDGLAGVVGQAIKRFNFKIFGNKTLLGCLTNLTVSTTVVLAFSNIYCVDISFFHALTIGIAATELEAFTGRGFDNITLPIGVLLISFAVINVPLFNEYVVPILLTPAIVYYALTKKKLTPVAVIGALILDALVSVAFGNIGFLILLIFLVCSIFADKLKIVFIKSRAHGDDFEHPKASKTECRGIKQVIANGLVPGVCAVMYFLTAEKVWLVCYVSGVAEALSDTVASCFGALANVTFDIFKLKKCEKGLSGGMSAYGTLSSLVFSALISTLGFCFKDFTIADYLIALICGFVGSIIDSFLGSVFQGKFCCQECGKLVEKKIHCGKAAKRVCGVSFIDNNTVNLLSNALSVCLCFLVFSLII